MGIVRALGGTPSLLDPSSSAVLLVLKRYSIVLSRPIRENDPNREVPMTERRNPCEGR